MNGKGETIAAIATASGQGGIGIVRASGPNALTVARKVCGLEPPPRVATYCSFRDAEGDLIDRGILLYFAAPASYTGEDVVELQGHGGSAVLERVLQACMHAGARLAAPGEFTERAYLNNRMDLLQAEAVADLVNSSSLESARSAMRSLEGEFSSSINRLVGELEQLRVYTESALDFPDEEIDFLKESDLGNRLSQLTGQVENILASVKQGRVMREGASISILGEPNVGKSSLLNCLSKTDRAIVSSQPGTTRDTLEDSIIVGGIPLQIVDTAGIRETTDEIEQEGISRAQRSAEKADIVLLVREAGAENRQSKAEELVPKDVKHIVVMNKIDLQGTAARSESRSEKETVVYVSALTGEGIDILREEISQQLNPAGLTESALPGRLRHIEAIDKCLEHLATAKRQLASDKPAAELVAEDLLQAQQNLESMTGRTTADDLLGKIFSSFCIGK